MIPYEELVTALQTWRAKQGLPITQMAGAVAPAAASASGPMAAAPGAPRTNPPGAPPRTNPPGAPPRSATPAPDEALDVDEAAMLEESAYENEGGDFAMSFADKPAVESDDEATAIGGAPKPGDSYAGTDPTGRRRGRGGNDDW